MALIVVPTADSKARGGRRLVSCLLGHAVLGALALAFLSVAPQSFSGVAPTLIVSYAAALPEPASGAPAVFTLAVTSADGHEGFELISALLKEPSAVHVRAIVADITSANAQTLAQRGCTLRVEGAPEAFAGASSALILPPLTADRLQRATAAIAQAAAAGLGLGQGLGLGLGSGSGAGSGLGSELANPDRHRDQAAAARVPAAYLLSVMGADSPSAPPSLGEYGQLEQALRS